MMASLLYLYQSAARGGGIIFLTRSKNSRKLKPKGQPFGGPEQPSHEEGMSPTLILGCNHFEGSGRLNMDRILNT